LQVVTIVTGNVQFTPSNTLQFLLQKYTTSKEDPFLAEVHHFHVWRFVITKNWNNRNNTMHAILKIRLICKTSMPFTVSKTFFYVPVINECFSLNFLVSGKLGKFIWKKAFIKFSFCQFYEIIVNFIKCIKFVNPMILTL